MKYAPLLEAYCRVLDMVRSDMVLIGDHIHFHATPNVIPGFIVFRRSSNTTPGLALNRLGSRDMEYGNWYIYLSSLVGMTPSC